MFSAFRRAFKSQNFERLAFLVWMAVLAFLVSRHHSWRDEFQSLLVAVVPRSWGELWEAMRYERTPPVLYLIQRGLWNVDALKGFGAEWFIRVTTIPFSIVFTWIWMFRIPGLSRAEKILVPFSVFVLREYSMIARSYPMGLSFLAGAAWARAQGRHHWALVLLALAMNTHALIFLIGGVILAQLIWSERRQWIGLLRTHWVATGVTSILLCVAVLNQIPPSDAVFGTSPTLDLGTVISRSVSFLGRVFLTPEWLKGRFELNAYVTRIFHGIFVLGVLLWHARKTGYSLRSYLLTIMGPLLVVGALYPGRQRHAGLLWISFWLVPLILKPGKPVRGTVFTILPFAATLLWIGAWSPWSQPPNFDFSDSRAVAEKIASQEVTPTVISNHWGIFSVLGRTPFTLIDASTDRIVTYPKGVKASSFTLTEWCQNHASRLADMGRRGPVWFVILTEETFPENDVCGKTQLIYETARPTATDEAYRIYKWLGEGAKSPEPHVN